MKFISETCRVHLTRYLRFDLSEIFQTKCQNVYIYIVGNEYKY